MRADSVELVEANASSEKDSRFIIVQSLDNADTDLLYLPSHEDVALPGGGTVFAGLIEGVSATSQKLNPDQGRAEIGSINYSIVDAAAQLTNYLSAKYGFGYSIYGKRTQVFFGYKNFTSAQYTLVQTQQVSSNEYLDGVYSIGCHDIQRAMRKDIFEPKKTKITIPILESDTVDGAGSPIPFVLSVSSTAEFELVEHGNSYSDAPDQTVGYLRSNDTFIRYSGKTASTFTGCIVVFGTRMESFDAGQDIEELIYLEMPAPKLAYAVKTNILHNQNGARTPAHWGLGIAPSLVRLSDFTNRVDWWDENNDSATASLRFLGETRTDGKQFLEEQVYLVMGAYSPVYADGSLGFRSMVSVVPGASTILELNNSNVFNYGALRQDYQALRNQIHIFWNWDPIKDDFSRDNLLVGTKSIDQYVLSDVMRIEARGLHGSIYSEEFLKVRFNSIADRYLNPPERINVDVNFGLNGTEIGDALQVNLNNVRDFVNGDLLELNRPMEVQQSRVDWINGGLNLELFGSNSRGEILSIASTVVLPDAYYTQNSNGEINLKEYLDNKYGVGVVFDDVTTPGVGRFIADCELVGAELMADAIYYYGGSLRVIANVIVSITDNVWLRRRGHMQVDGKVNGVGLGHPGDIAHTSIPVGGENEIHLSVGRSGYFGKTQAIGGIERYLISSGANGTGVASWRSFVRGVAGGSNDSSYIPPTTESNSIFDTPEITYDGQNLLGVPRDLRGSSGGAGGPFLDRYISGGQTQLLTLEQPGGDGGNGGAALITEGRGLDFGPGGSIDLSGTDGSPGVKQEYSGGRILYSGGGAGGEPGCWLDIKDGDSPLFYFGKFVANRGITPSSAPPLPSAGIISIDGYSYPRSSYYPGISGDLDRSDAVRRDVAIIGGEIPIADPDIGILTAPTGVSIITGTGALDRHAEGTVIAGARLSWVSSTDGRTLGYEVRYKLSSETEYRYALMMIIGRESVGAFISGLIGGTTMDFGVRAAGANRIKSDWVNLLNELIVGKEDPPPDVTGLLVHMTGNGLVSARWDQVDLDLAPDFSHYEFRYGPQNNALGWDDATPINVRLDANKVIAEIPPGPKRFFVKMKDTSKIASVLAAQYDMTVTSAYDVIESVDQQPDWPGVLGGFEKTLGDSLAPMQSRHSNQLAEGELLGENWVAYPVATCTYTSPVVDLSFVGPVRIWGDIDSHLGPGESGIANPALQVRVSDNNAAWTVWQGWESDIVTTRYVQYRLVLDTAQGSAIIDAMQCVADAQEWKQQIKGVAVGVGTTAVVFPLQHHTPPFVRINPVGDATLQVSYDPGSVTGLGLDVLADKAGIVDIETEGV